MKLGKTISCLRVEAGLSQSDLAEALGVSRQSVSKWETDAAVPELDKLMKLSELFHISLDQLVKGAETASQPEEIPEIQQETAPEQHRTRAKTAGLVLLCAGAVLACVFGVWYGPFGMILALPVLLPGAICCLAQRHPVLKAVWADYLLIDAFVRHGTGVKASNVFLTFKWSYQMNYFVLFLSWVLFLILAGIVVGTVLVLLKEDWKSPFRKKLTILLSVIGVLLTSRLGWRFLWMPVGLRVGLNTIFFTILLLLLDWIKIGAILGVVLALARYFRNCRDQKLAD